MENLYWCFISFFIWTMLCSTINGNHKSSCKLLRKRTWAKCSGRQYIPKIPQTVVNLMLKENRFPHIQRLTFSNISSNKISTLEFRSNRINHIENDSFMDLKYLKHLVINYEHTIIQSELSNAFQSLNKGMITLTLAHNKWREFIRHLFRHLSESNLTTLYLNDNQVSKVYFDIFISMCKLETLYLDGNEIAYVDIKDKQTIKKLDLSNNNIFLMPNFCANYDNVSLVPRLISLSLRNNAIRHIYQSSFKCLRSLLKLNLDGNRISVLASNVFTPLTSLVTLSISNFCQLERIGKSAFNSSSLEKLLFVHNNFRFDKRKNNYDIHKIFSFLPNLNHLTLEKNYLPKDEKSLRTMFTPLRQLIHISLASTFIALIPSVILQHNQQLETMILFGNKINGWDSSIFENASSLKTLDLSGNEVHTINETSFPRNFFNTIQTLNLAGNPYWCTCTQKWFLQTLRQTNLSQKLESWPGRYSCYYPEHLRFTLMSKYYPTDAECYPMNFIFIVMISVSSSVILMFLLIIFTFGCHVNIKNGLYLLRIYRRMKYGYVKVQSHYEFDAFIVYCSLDRQWVHTKLLKKLEKDGLNVCVHYREFNAGEPITDNIEKYMAKSWKIIVVMSNEFAKSEWCQWELDFVHERRRQQGKEALVLIMYRTIDSKHMTSRIRTLLSTTPHLRFKEGFGENMFWKAVVKDTKQSLDFPPTAQ